MRRIKCFVISINNKLLEKLTTKEELSGLLNFALKGLKRLHERGRFEDTIDLESMRIRYLSASDPISYFAKTMIVEKIGSEIDSDIVYQKYVLFCKTTKVKARQKAYFSRELRTYIPSLTILSTRRNKIAKTIYCNVILRKIGEEEEYDDENEEERKLKKFT